ncbi:MAG: MFS transporter [Butyricicoccus sp.]|nr:MFS transporter [Butyricicoccus sp.]
MNQKLFTRDFTMVVLGQIVSLFGNAALRFALPLYLLNLTGSAALYGTVTACAFIPAVLLSPVGGIIADRVNKRNIMVTLDFLTSALVLGFILLMDAVDLTALLTVTLMLLYGIAGAYQPSVQASIPALAAPDNFMAANSVINTVSSFSSLTGPVLGGILYSAYGLRPVLWLCACCFALSAVMEIFIRIPFQRLPGSGGVLETVRADFAGSLRFILREKPFIGRVVLVVCAINLFLSAMLIVALPYLITEVLSLDTALANRLYAFSEGAFAAGGLTGGVCAGLLGSRLRPERAHHLLMASVLCVFPMAAVLPLCPGLVSYAVITVCCFVIMVFSTVFSVQMMSVLQSETPQELIGKVISVILTISMCAQPLGNALYGTLFELCAGAEWAVVLFSAIASLLIAVTTGKLFRQPVPER